MTLTIAGIILILVVTAAGALLLWPGSPFSVMRLERGDSILPFIIVLPPLALYFAAAIGIVFRTRWGYFLTKAFLYLLWLAFPAGTVIAYVTLPWLRRSDVKRRFGVSPSSGSAIEAYEERWFGSATTIFSSAAILLFLWMMLAF
jgi:hypothetical protein